MAEPATALEDAIRENRLLRALFGRDVRGEWRAFWRVYRALRREDVFEDLGIAEAARELFRGRVLEWYDEARRIENQEDRLACPVGVRLIMWRMSRFLYAVGKSFRRRTEG